MQKYYMDSINQRSGPKFHINSKGEAAPCKATKRACKFGKSDHFTNLKEATREAERRLAYETGGALKSYRKETPVREASDPVSRTPNIDNLAKSRSCLDDFGKSVRFYKNATIEDVELTARNAEYQLKGTFRSSSISVKTADPNRYVHLSLQSYRRFICSSGIRSYYFHGYRSVFLKTSRGRHAVYSLPL